jgi:hypothetical protein
MHHRTSRIDRIGLRAMTTNGWRVAWVMCLLLTLSAVHAPEARAGFVRTGQVQIMSVDASAHPQVSAAVVVRDAFGRGVEGLKAQDVVVEEHGRVVPTEHIQITPTGEPAAIATVAIVADISALLGSQEIEEVRDDVYLLFKHLLHNADEAEVALFVPRSNALDQSLIVAPFTTDFEEALRALENTEPRNGRTDLYNAVVAAVNTSADRAIQHGGPAYVVVLSDGQDRTSIVGSGVSGANEAARLAEERHVPVFTFGYGRNRGAALMAQVADRTGGTYQPNPTEEDITAFVNTMLASARAGSYEVTYRSSLPTDGAEHVLTIRVLVDNLPLTAEARYLSPRPWDSTTLQRLDMQVDARAYPEVTLWVRPVNQLRRTVPDLNASDFQLSIDGSPLTSPLKVTVESFDVHDPAAAQSVALVVDLRAEWAREMAISLLQTPTDIPMRVALFVPGLPGQSETFTHDHNAIINALNQARTDEHGDVGTTLLLAIAAAARDADAHTRPAYVVLISDESLMPDLRVRAVTEAREQRVTISTITTNTGSGATALARLAAATGGQHAVNPDPLHLSAIAETIARDRATRYRITFQAPLLADGAEHKLTLEVGGMTADTSLTPFIGGDVSVHSPLTVTVQVLIFSGAALVMIIGALAPRIVSDRRLRCPSCGRVRRASWGDACLFCEIEGMERRTGRGMDVPLEGFAMQGASLVATPVRAAPPDRAISKPSTAKGQHAPANRSRTKDLRVLVQEESAPLQGDPGTSSRNDPLPSHTNGSDVAVQQDPAFKARMRSHTDFWGQLPDEERPESPVSNAGLSVTPEHHADESSAPPVLPIFELLETPEMPVAKLRVWEAPVTLRESTHTDFWGPLTDEEVSASSDHVREDSSVDDSACAQPEAAVSHTDFWGPLPDDNASGEKQNHQSAKHQQQ